MFDIGVRMTVELSIAILVSMVNFLCIANGTLIVVHNVAMVVRIVENVRTNNQIIFAVVMSSWFP